MKLGMELLLDKYKNLIKGRNIGILAHAASVNSKGEHVIDLISQTNICKITTLFGPEHGISTTAEDMIPVGSTTDSARGVPIYSLYGNTLDSLKPTKEILSNIDVLIIDLQDVGSRYYTYVWTACLCVEACAEMGKKIIVCDRPNPIGGFLVEGQEIENGFESFVGLHSLPVRHGMTIGEIVNLVNRHSPVVANLEVIKMEGWRREMNWPDTKLPWTNPSPNMRSYSAALLYPGMCLIEGTNISEGRGTDTPFEIVGAPYFNSEEFIAEFNKLSLPGVHAAPTSFIPTHQKWMGRVCHGVRWIISDINLFRPYLTGLMFIWLARRLYKNDGFEWRTAPYEFVTERPAIDLLTGTSLFREKIDSIKIKNLEKLAMPTLDSIKKRESVILY